jgi:signal transduction histidine kinase
MTLRMRVTLLYALLVGGLMALFAVAVYVFSANYRLEEFTQRLHERAEITAKLVLDEEELDEKALAVVRRRFNEALHEESVRVLAANDSVVYEKLGAELQLPPQALATARKQGMFTYQQGSRQTYIMQYHDNQGLFLIVATAQDLQGLDRLSQLALTLVVGWCVGMVLIAISGWYLASQAFKPIQRVVESARQINATDLHLRVAEARRPDELGHMARTFNDLLERLEGAFVMQKTFVSNASHEMRTPLTTLKGELSMALNTAKTPEEYHEVMASALEETNRLAELTDQLLWLAQASGDPATLKRVPLRLDETIFTAREQVLQKYPNAVVEVDFAAAPDDDAWLERTGNQRLLEVAFRNVIDNAVKYSPPGKHVLVSITPTEAHTEISIADTGTGIDYDDQLRITMPFYRGRNNGTQYPGHGIGLHLTKRIMELHGGTLRIKSAPQQGTTVTLDLPR